MLQPSFLRLPSIPSTRTTHVLLSFLPSFPSVLVPVPILTVPIAYLTFLTTNALSLSKAHPHACTNQNMEPYYEEDVLTDLPTPEPTEWTRPLSSNGRNSSRTHTQSSSYTDSTSHHSYPRLSDKLHDHTTSPVAPSYAMPRVATPIPASTMRESYLEAVRQSIDAEQGGDTTRRFHPTTRRVQHLAEARLHPYGNPAVASSPNGHRSRSAGNLSSSARLRSSRLSSVGTSKRLKKTARAIADGCARAFRKRA